MAVTEVSRALMQVRSLLDQVHEVLRSEPTKAIQLAESALQLADKHLSASSIDSDHNRQLSLVRAEALLKQGISFNHLTQYENATDTLQKSLRIFEALEEYHGLTQSLNNLGMVLFNKGEYSNALERYHKSLALSRQAGNRRAEMAALLNIGNVFFKLGDLTRALECYQQSYSTNKSMGNAQSESYHLANIGSVHAQMGNFRKALLNFQESLAIKETINDRLGQANMHINIADSCMSLEQYDDTLRHALKCLNLSFELGVKTSQIHALQLVGNVYTQKGDYERARKHFDEALEEARLADYTSGEIQTLISLGTLFCEQREAAKAIEALEECLKLAHRTESTTDIINIHLALSNAYKAKKDFEKALEHYEKYHTLERRVLNEETTAKAVALQTWHASEQSLIEAEVYRLKNVELAKVNKRLQELDHERTEFLGIAAHDLKNHLSAIILSAGIMQRNINTMNKKEARKQLNRIELAAKHMRDVIINLLDMNKLESGSIDLSLARFDILPLCEAVTYDYLEYAASKNIQLRGHWNDDALYAYADSEKVQVIVENLLSNAIKFSPADTTVDISALHYENMIRIEVRDEGPGISENDHKKLFGKFARLSAKPTGGEHSTGLGLSIVKKLVDSMHGRIWCESELNKGTRFIVLLPSS